MSWAAGLNKIQIERFEVDECWNGFRKLKIKYDVLVYIPFFK